MPLSRLLCCVRFEILWITICCLSLEGDWFGIFNETRKAFSAEKYFFRWPSSSLSVMTHLTIFRQRPAELFQSIIGCSVFDVLWVATHVFLLSIKLCDLNQKLIFEKRNSVSWYVNGLIRFLKFFILKLNKKIQSFASFQLCKVPFPKTFFILPQLRFKIVSLREPTNDCEPLCVLSFVFRDISFYVEVFFKFYHAPTRAINIYFFISFLFIPISICAEGRFRKRSSKLNSAVIKSLFIRRQQEKRCFHAATVNNSKLILFCKWSIWL